MITLNFSVDDQLLTRTDENTVAANSHLVHVCEFVFSSEWNGRGKVATFKKRDLMLSVILDDDACTIPPEILQSENKIDVFELSVCGADGNSTITSTVVKVPILAGTWDVMSTEITPTMFEQIMAKIEEIEEDELTIEDVNNAIEEYFEEHPDAVINTSEVFNAIVNSGLINLNIKYTYYKDHYEKTDAAAGVNYYVIAPGHIGGYDSNDYGTVMVNINEGGALAESIYEFYTSGNNLPEGKYQLRNAWSIGTPGVSVIFAYVNEGVEHVLATVDSEHEAAYFEITEEIAGYSQKLYIKVNPGAEYGGQINPLLTYGYVTDFSNIPGCYVATNTELTREVNNLKDSTTNLQGRVLNIETGKQDKIQYAVMPAASADLLGKIYQYTAATNANYTQGHWYKCVENSGVYSWESTGEDGNIPNITATATVDNTTGTPAVNVTKAGTDAAPEFTFAFTGLKGPKGDPGPSGYDDTELRGKINDVWKAQGQLGAKNLLPFPYAQKSQTTAGITYTVDDKGRISTSGTSTGVTNFQLNNNLKLDEESYIITDGCADKTTQYIVVWYKHGNTTDVLATTKYVTSATFSITQEQAAAMKNGESYIVVRLMGDNSNMVWDNLTFNPMIRYAGDTDNTWQPYTLTNYELDSRITNGVNNIYQLQGELGAKNLLRYPYYDASKVAAGITFTVNDDGSVTMNGTSTSYPAFIYALRNYNIKGGEYFITCAEELPNGVRVDVGEANTLDSTTITDFYTTLGLNEHEKKFTVPSNAQNFAVRIQFNPNATVSNLTLHVMIRSAIDTDNTWKPYAPTNYNLNEKIEDLKESLNTSSIIGITCWGDSLTAMGGWTQKLQELSGIPVYNGGTGGEDSKCIMARQGGDVMITDGITIPATATAVTIASRATDTGISTELGNKVTPLYQASAHVNPVTLGDIPGTLAWTGSDYTDQNGTWTFTRATAGEAVVIDRPTAIRTNFDDVHNGKNELMIIYMGANGGWSDVADLIHQHKLMIDHFKGKEYVILGLSTGTAASSADYEAAMKEAFGRRFISLREYLAHPIYENGEIVSCYGLADQGLAPGTKEYAGVTYNSLDEIAVGTVPHQLLIDGIHYTTGTREVIGNMIYRKLKELNILT